MARPTPHYDYKILSLKASYIYNCAKSSFNGIPKLYCDNTIRYSGQIDMNLETIYMENKGLFSDERDNCKDKAYRFKCEGEHYTDAFINVTFSNTHKVLNQMTTPSGIAYVLEKYVIFTEGRGENSDYSKLIRDHILIKDGKIIAVEVPYSEKSGNEASGLKNNYVKKWNELSPNTPFAEFFEIKAEGRRKYFSLKADSNNIYISKNTRELREELYKDGFKCGGNKYIRYKRSAGKGREGSCLFIKESIAKAMNDWSSAGLEAEKWKIEETVGWEAYRALTMSSLMKDREGKPYLLKIKPENILVIPDAKAAIVGKNIIGVKEKSDPRMLETFDFNKDKCKEYNTIWDGQALIDSSVFESVGLKDKGMMLLRGRFFKTCGFNTNLQKWFSDNGIKSPKDLSDFIYPKPKKLTDIKMIVTPSSVKYLKFCDKGKGLLQKKGIKTWLKSLEELPFGIVKTDKPTGYFDGNLVAASYQFLNTLDMNKDNASALLKNSIDYLDEIRTDPSYMVHYLKLSFNKNEMENIEYDAAEDIEEYEGEEKDEEILASESTMDCFAKMLECNPDFFNTKIFHGFKSNIVKSFREKLKHGRILVHGTYATLFGNGAEMLTALLKKEKGKSYSKKQIEEKGKKIKTLFFKNPVGDALSGNEIYTKFFGNNENLVCARSPHISMGNLLNATNKNSKIYSDYFNFTKEIVCINSINNDILDRLGGADFDSDTMLITDNETILKCSKPLAVPINTKHHEAVEFDEKTYTNGYTDFLSEIDCKVSNNKVGNITNLSQILNSIYWTWKSYKDTGSPELEYMGGITRENCDKYMDELYRDICILSVMTGMEIDKAKRDYKINCSGILKDIENKHKKEYLEHYCTPEFLCQIMNRKKSKLPDKCTSAMANIFSCVCDNGESGKTGRPKKTDPKTTTLAQLIGIPDTSITDPNSLGKISEICKNVNRDRGHWASDNKKRKMDANQRLEASNNWRKIKASYIEEIRKELESNDNRLFENIIISMEQEKGILSSYKNFLIEALVTAPDSELLKRLKENSSGAKIKKISLTKSDEINESLEACEIYGIKHIMYEN